MGEALRGLVRIAAVGAAGWVAIAAAACVFQRRLLYFPDPSTPERPGGIDGLEEIELSASDGVRSKAWYAPGQAPLAFLLLHGNAGHRGHRADWIRELRRAFGAAVMVLDYRGYGGSEGAPTEEGLYRDGVAALEWLEGRARGAIVLAGESLGGAVAVELAARRPPAALILVNTASSLAAVGQRAYPILPVRLLMWDRFDALRRIGGVRCPLLQIHAGRDSIVPIGIGRALFEAAREPKEWAVIPGADHNDVPYLHWPAFLEHVRAFLLRHEPTRAALQVDGPP